MYKGNRRIWALAPYYVTCNPNVYAGSTAYSRLMQNDHTCDLELNVTTRWRVKSVIIVITYKKQRVA